MSLELYAILLVFSPLVAAAVVGFNTRIISDYSAQAITCSGVIISALCAGVLFKSVALDGAIVHIKLLEWIRSGDFIVDWSIYIDVLTSMMLLLITSVSALVHIYSIGYMSHDAHKPRFMAYLSLFTFCMIMLVCADNLVQLFFGWEGVGLSSYLLIGFWYKRESASSAAMKAFLVNRVGDLGFALGIFLIYLTFGSVEFSQIFSQIPGKLNQTIPFMGCEVSNITVICLLLFIGCMGKSAQLGLHTWLPDAMEGPTPVSALIHAATMVTAGVFLTARCSPLFEHSEVALNVITIVGAFTCIFAATVALVQTDIKKIIAYSTCSQLGYMFFASGVSAYAAGVFHLLTHGFFKALLFLSAGSVIHAMSDEQNINKMGGIWKLIPFTFVMMWIGSLALGGIYPFAGFYSKDIILESAYAAGSIYGKTAYWLGISAAVLTAFYSWRLLILVFQGKTRASKEVISHVHESPLSMTVPLLILAVGAVFAGYIGYNTLDIVSPNGEFWRGSIVWLEHHNTLEKAHHVEAWVKWLPLLAGILGIFAAYILYMFAPDLPNRLQRTFSAVHKFLFNKWYFDELYNVLFVKSSKLLGLKLWKIADAKIVDSMPNGAALTSYRFARVVSFLQTGYIYHYALVMLLGLVLLLTWSLIRI
ncbi:NADH-quinone oxidoreductase subunit L [Holosporaceae bacterium 'Namur']|nr:NADH-quinone oxidoreductase subunit L [Holosporaceae bacterium 'Namur']